MTSALSRLMANINGPRPSKRRLLMSVTQSILLYGSEIWANALKKKVYRKRIRIAGVQYRGALRIACSYRTVSEPAALVIAGIIPIDLLALERRSIFERTQEVGKKNAKAEVRDSMQDALATTVEYRHKRTMDRKTHPSAKYLGRAKTRVSKLFADAIPLWTWPLPSLPSQNGESAKP